MEKICAEFNWTVNDYTEAQSIFWRRTRPLQMYLSILFSAVLTALLFLLFPEIVRDRSEAELVMLPVLAWVSFFGLYILILNQTRRVAVRVSARRFAPVGESLYYVLDQNGLLMSSNLVDSKVKWPYFKTWGESENLFILVTSTLHYIVPKRAVESGAIDQVRELLCQNIGPEGL